DLELAGKHSALEARRQTAGGTRRHALGALTRVVVALALKLEGSRRRRLERRELDLVLPTRYDNARRVGLEFALPRPVHPRARIGLVGFLFDGLRLDHLRGPSPH